MKNSNFEISEHCSDEGNRDPPPVNWLEVRRQVYLERGDAPLKDRLQSMCVEVFNQPQNQRKKER